MNRNDAKFLAEKARSNRSFRDALDSLLRDFGVRQDLADSRIREVERDHRATREELSRCVGTLRSLEKELKENAEHIQNLYKDIQVLQEKNKALEAEKKKKEEVDLVRSTQEREGGKYEGERSRRTATVTGGSQRATSLPSCSCLCYDLVSSGASPNTQVIIEEEEVTTTTEKIPLSESVEKDRDVDRERKGPRGPMNEINGGQKQFIREKKSENIQNGVIDTKIIQVKSKVYDTECSEEDSTKDQKVTTKNTNNYQLSSEKTSSGYSNSIRTPRTACDRGRKSNRQTSTDSEETYFWDYSYSETGGAYDDVTEVINKTIMANGNIMFEPKTRKAETETEADTQTSSGDEKTEGPKNYFDVKSKVAGKTETEVFFVNGVQQNEDLFHQKTSGNLNKVPKKKKTQNNADRSVDEDYIHEGDDGDSKCFSFLDKRKKITNSSVSEMSTEQKKDITEPPRDSKNKKSVLTVESDTKGGRVGVSSEVADTTVRFSTSPSSCSSLSSPASSTPTPSPPGSPSTPSTLSPSYPSSVPSTLSSPAASPSPTSVPVLDHSNVSDGLLVVSPSPPESSVTPGPTSPPHPPATSTSSQGTLPTISPSFMNTLVEQTKVDQVKKTKKKELWCDLIENEDDNELDTTCVLEHARSDVTSCSSVSVDEASSLDPRKLKSDPSTVTTSVVTADLHPNPNQKHSVDDVQDNAKSESSNDHHSINLPDTKEPKSDPTTVSTSVVTADLHPNPNQKYSVDDVQDNAKSESSTDHHSINLLDTKEPKSDPTTVSTSVVTADLHPNPDQKYSVDDVQDNAKSESSTDHHSIKSEHDETSATDTKSENLPVILDDSSPSKLTQYNKNQCSEKKCPSLTSDTIADGKCESENTKDNQLNAKLTEEPKMKNAKRKNGKMTQRKRTSKESRNKAQVEKKTSDPPQEKRQSSGSIPDSSSENPKVSSKENVHHPQVSEKTKAPVRMSDPGKSPEEKELGMCANCSEIASQRCAMCHQVFYCKRECQKKHWKTHREQCQPFKVEENSDLGRYMVASRNIKAGEVVLIEDPIVIGPKQITEPVCLGCYKRVDGSYTCSKCSWPLCGIECEQSPDHKPECLVGIEIGSPIQITNFDDTNHFYEIITALRCLALKKKSPKKYEQLMALESHYEDRKGSHIYKENQIRVVGMLRNYFMLLEFDPDVIDCSEYTIHKVMGILDVNALEIRQPESEIQGVYPRFAMLEHACVPNTKHKFDENKKVEVRAAVDIAKGEHLSTMYTHILWGTTARRDHLKHNKYFMCQCQRCSDPTELGTYFSALRCTRCPEAYMVSAAPLDLLASWICTSCNYTLTPEEVTDFNLKLGEEVERCLAQPSVDVLERLIAEKSKTVHPNHFHLFACKHTLLQMYGRDKTNPENANFGEPMDAEVNKKKEQLCQAFLKMCMTLDPGMSRLAPYVGVTLYEYHLAMIAKARRALEQDPVNNKSQAKKELENARALLQQCMTVLKDEPEDQPEGALFKVAKGNLEELSAWAVSLA
ncbi:uncharacterized protein LOC143028136 [Oratosquilla oratoria]|uniref:uncharacterized protein LOC143028136 n=1 Tax=Oratosquilla oratoria TaxID=337810 RepID=UPI003F775433